MNIIGKWKLKGFKTPTENGLELHMLADASEEMLVELEETLDMLIEFCEDHTFNWLYEANEKYLALAEESGAVKRDDGYIVAFTGEWEEKDGKILYDSGAEGEILGEQIDPFVELEFTDDGDILYNYGMLLYERM